MDEEQARDTLALAKRVHDDLDMTVRTKRIDLKLCEYRAEEMEIELHAFRKLNMLDIDGAQEYDAWSGARSQPLLKEQQLRWAEICKLKKESLHKEQVIARLEEMIFVNHPYDEPSSLLPQRLEGNLYLRNTNISLQALQSLSNELENTHQCGFRQSLPE